MEDQLQEVLVEGDEETPGSSGSLQKLQVTGIGAHDLFNVVPVLPQP